MKIFSPLIPRLFGIGFSSLIATTSASAQVTITVNPSQTFQTINGWEATTWAGQEDPAFPLYRDQMFDKAVNDLGLTRVRLEVRSGAENSTDWYSWYLQDPNGRNNQFRCYRYATVNDNNDANSIASAGFKFTELDETVDKVVLPLRQKLAAAGGTLAINLNYVAFDTQMNATGCPAGLGYGHKNPDEYAEFILATIQHLKTKYNIVPNFVEALLEPDNTTWTATQLGQAIETAGRRLAQNGFFPKFIAPSTTSGPAARTWIDAIAAVPNALQYIEEFSYHRYVQPDDSILGQIAARGAQHGKKTSMLEYIGATATHLHKDLKIGNNSSWQQFTLGGVGNDDGGGYFFVTNPSAPVVNYGARTKFIRQYFKFIRPGAVRIGASTNNGGFDPVAFINTGQKYVVVVNTSGSGAFNVTGLPAGTYGIKYSTGSFFDANHSDQTIQAGGTISTSIPEGGVLTIYAKTGGTSDTLAPASPSNLRMN